MGSYISTFSSAVCIRYRRLNRVIYIELLEDGATAWRPISAELLASGLFRILGPVPEDEIWAFHPGDIVRCKVRTFSGGASELAAYQLADN